ncbi:hypothetical protein E8D34_18195 [Nocardioides sp. GY 10113]|uniref:hypothetical protein n=1 Tax=Nocardioides sp. GY 10113 TaxID=2569761 RepID=UPI0010A8F828|nr:hypothetical protein [Nocardioides sp. GY 10113]TIC81325.1 hypothetical protein E8D34_18195 [Nocardioides sp. GY 10113]
MLAVTPAPGPQGVLPPPVVAPASRMAGRAAVPASPEPFPTSSPVPFDTWSEQPAGRGGAGGWVVGVVSVLLVVACGGVGLYLWQDAGNGVAAAPGTASVAAPDGADAAADPEADAGAQADAEGDAGGEASAGAVPPPSPTPTSATTEATTEVTSVLCWDGSTAARRSGCPGLTGLAAIQWVFPSPDLGGGDCATTASSGASVVLEVGCRVTAPSGPVTLTFQEWASVAEAAAHFEARFGSPAESVVGPDGSPVFFQWTTDTAAVRLFVVAPFSVIAESPGDASSALSDRVTVNYRPAGLLQRTWGG